MEHTCPHCGGHHTAACPRVEEIEYHQNGTVKRVKYRDPWGRGSASTPVFPLPPLVPQVTFPPVSVTCTDGANGSTRVTVHC